MSNPTQVPSKLINKSTDVAHLGYSCVNDLGALFHAIAQASDKDCHVAQLANMGSYLSTCWANLLDCERKDLERQLPMGGINE